MRVYAVRGRVKIEDARARETQKQDAKPNQTLSLPSFHFQVADVKKQ